jgi:type II secretory pathway pseudopilin PulG
MHARRWMRKSSGGFAFIATLMVMLVIAILLMAVLTMAMSSRLMAGSRQEYAQALYLAEAGINALISDWRARGPANAPAQPYVGQLLNNGAPGSYSVTWATAPNAPSGRTDWIQVRSVGTVNTNVPGTALHVSRTVEAWLDTDGDWAWNHVWYADSDIPGMEPPDYANIGGSAGEVVIGQQVVSPEEYTGNPHGPAGGGVLPSPIWDKWHAWVEHDLAYDPVTKQQVPRDTNHDGVPDPRWPDQATLPACSGTRVDATSNRHMYWYGSPSLDPAAHASDRNFFMPDPLGFSNPYAYICGNTLTVTFDKTTGNCVGNYFVHGNIIIKQDAEIHGTLIATGDITFQGTPNVIMPEAVDPDAPCAERVYYPGLIAGGNVLVRDQGKGGGTDPSRTRVNGIIWAGASYTGQAADTGGCIVSPSVNFNGNWMAEYGIYNIDGCDYLPGQSPPPWFREPDRGEMNPVPQTWRER